MNLPTAVDSQLISTEEKRSALDTVLASGAFSRADQLRSFLRFICKMELEGRGAEISEYLIAVEALGRPKDFSSVEDSSVRVMARSLRQKLDEFYAHEKPDAPIRIEIVKGAYHPRFVRVAKSAAEDGTPKLAEIPPVFEKREEKADAVQRPTFLRGLVWFAGGIAVATAISLVIFLQQSKTAVSSGLPALDPIVRSAWSPIARQDSNVLIALGNPLHMIFHPYPVLLPRTVQEFPAPPGAYEFYRAHRPLPADAPLTIHPVDNSVSMGQLLGVVTATRVLDAAGASYQVLPEHAAPLASFRGRNVLLIGAAEDSPAVEALLKGLPLRTEFDPKLREIIAKNDKTGKVYVPTRDAMGHYTQVYGLVTVMPSEGISAGGKKTIVFSGITSVGSNAAIEFMASPQSLQSLLDRFKGEGYKTFPSSYQVLVRATTGAETLLVSKEYETHVILDKTRN